jgi:DNA-directed RNA polymerase subunit RPC12/RpoP
MTKKCQECGAEYSPEKMGGDMEDVGSCEACLIRSLYKPKDQLVKSSEEELDFYYGVNK